MRQIQVLNTLDLAELCAEFTKLGMTFEVSKRGDGFWYIELYRCP